MKYWIHELHSKRFGKVLGEKPLPASLPAEEFHEPYKFWTSAFVPPDDSGEPF